MNVRDRVCVSDEHGTYSGTITMRHSDGVCVVKWDAGTTERIMENKLRRVPDGVSVPMRPLSDQELDEILSDEGAPDDDPKTYRDRLSELWDSRPWK